MHLWAIFIGIGALALPLLVHFLTKARPTRAALSTIRFIHEAVQQKRARHRLRDILILACRIAAIALIALAFARPLTGSQRAAAAEKAAAVERIVILDASFSMSAISRGTTLYERARAAANRHLQFDSGLHANLIFAAARPRGVFERTSPNLGALNDELGRSAPRAERLNLSAAITAAADMLQKGSPRPNTRRELVILSDLQRTNWSAADFSPLPADTHITLESLAPEAPLDNIAITDAQFAGRVAQNRETRLEIEVANHTRAPRTVQVQVTLDGRTYPLEKLCPPNTRTRMAAPVTLAAAGAHLGEARLVAVDDALPADNTRALAVRVLPAPAYLLITRQSPEPRAISSHYLERALLPQADLASKSADRLTRIEAPQLDRDALASADMVLLDHPGKLDAPAISLLASSLRRGKSILYVACEPVDANNLKLLTDAAGTDLKLPVEFVPAPRPRSGLQFADVRAVDPVFAVFGENLRPAVDTLRFATLLSSKRLPTGLPDDILASFDDRSAALVVSDCAAGTLAILNADLSSSNLATTGALVPILGELSTRLLGKRSNSHAFVTGDPAALPIPAETASALTLSRADKLPIDSASQFLDEQGTPVYRTAAAPAPGGYLITRANAPAPLATFATAAPAEESDLSPLDAALIKTRLAGNRPITFLSGSDDPQSRDRAWLTLALAAAGCLLAELVLLRVFRT